MNIEDHKCIILKIGTTSITKDCDQGVNLDLMEKLAAAAKDLRSQSYRVIIVSSGAMGLGVAKLGKETIEARLGVDPCQSSMTGYKQALTSVGQIELMNAYENIFGKYGAHVGQVLVTHAGLDDKERNETIQRTLERMFELDLVPIVNANDTVATKELTYGDNDSLSARIAVLVKAKRLMILSDVAGLYDSDPNKNPDAKLITIVKNIDDQVKGVAGESSSVSGMGGMKSKINAVEICIKNKIPVDIICASEVNDILSKVNEPEAEIRGTRFLVA